MCTETIRPCANERCTNSEYSKFQKCTVTNCASKEYKVQSGAENGYELIYRSLFAPCFGTLPLESRYTLTKINYEKKYVSATSYCKDCKKICKD